MGDHRRISLAVRRRSSHVGSVQRFVEVFIFVYILLLFAYILTSWIRLPYNPWLNRVQRFLYDVCDPYLRIFRRFLPPLGPLDLSPMVGVITLSIVQRSLVSLLQPSLERRTPMALTPVEIRHLKLGRGFLGYKRAVVDRLLGRDRRELRGRLARARRPRRPGRAARGRPRRATRSSRGCCARRSSPPRAPPSSCVSRRAGGRGVVAEAHAEARAISRARQRREGAARDRARGASGRSLHSALDSARRGGPR